MNILALAIKNSIKSKVLGLTHKEALQVAVGELNYLDAVDPNLIVESCPYTYWINVLDKRKVQAWHEGKCTRDKAIVFQVYLDGDTTVNDIRIIEMN